MQCTFKRSSNTLQNKGWGGAKFADTWCCGAASGWRTSPLRSAVQFSQRDPLRVVHRSLNGAGVKFRGEVLVASKSLSIYCPPSMFLSTLGDKNNIIQMCEKFLSCPALVQWKGSGAPPCPENRVNADGFPV